jgi:hypothetical protein
MRKCVLGLTGYIRDVEPETHAFDAFATARLNQPDSQFIRFHWRFT